LELDLVEMDPSVVKAAERYFEYSPGKRHHVYVQDARTFLRSTHRKYDIIWVDVFARHLIPFHLTTQEFFAEVQGHLLPEGVIAVNLSSSNAELDVLRAQAVATTFQSAFPNMEAFSVEGPSWLATRPGSANLIFFAGANASKMRDTRFGQILKDLVDQDRLPPEALMYFSTHSPIDLDTGFTLTDDYSPLDILQGAG
jgi:spermidine synthase